ncbi:MAG: hypothetical protein Q9191_006086, partial [Dirinaria sp. TL-2023a]
MRSSLNARRKARIIGQDDAPSHDSTAQPELSGPDQDPDPIPAVIRPTTSRSSSKKRSSLRVSFGPGGTSMTGDGDPENTSAVFTPKKSNLSRAAIANNALRKSQLSSEHGLLRSTDERPRYTAESLHELKNSTPSTPKKDLDAKEGEEEEEEGPETQALDLAAKFGTDLALRTGDGLIPTEAEIAEKKARRRRLAQEQEYISLHQTSNSSPSPSNSSSSEEENETRISLLNPNNNNHNKRKPQKYPSTRLVPDDEDIAEGFDSFVEDEGRVALGRTQAREQRRREKERIRALISEAEHGHSPRSASSSSSSANEENEEDDSEAERRAAYEASQTRAGLDGLLLASSSSSQQQQRPRTPPKITPLPSLSGVLGKLSQRRVLLETQRRVRVKRMEEIAREKEE